MRLDEGWGATRAIIPALGRAGLGWCEPAGLCPWHLTGLHGRVDLDSLSTFLLPTPCTAVVV